MSKISQNILNRGSSTQFLLTKVAGWYNFAKKTEKWTKVRKIAPIFAINYQTAVEKGIVDDGKLSVDGKLMTVDSSFMICRDKNCNIWPEKKVDFAKRYKKTDFFADFWQKYEPTEDAINLSRKKDENNGYEMQENKKNGKKWEITEKEFDKNYEEA